jgi:predicted transcriptional regulator
MELHLPLELQGKLAAAASRRGVSVEVLAREALERAVDFDDWFIREVETGLAQVDAGQTLTHDAVGERMAKKLAEHEAGR